MITRRSFLKKGSLAAGVIGLNSLQSCGSNKIVLKGSLAGPNMSLGHKVRDLTNVKPVEVSSEDVVIVGGGVAGLSAARWLNNNAVSFRLLELEGEAGGNSRYRADRLGRFPLGAHYLPIPSARHTSLLKFLEECGVITGYSNDLPVFNEYHLCFDPKERLFIEHHWQEGLIPHDGTSQEERDHLKKFHDLMHHYRELKGSDGLFAFDIPLDNCSQDKELLGLDNITMDQFMIDHGLTSPAARWYVNYCCTDDFGSTLKETSAWAGVHYFASRKGKSSNAGIEDVLTWPEGNGFLVDHLRKDIKDRIFSKSVALAVTPTDKNVTVDYFDATANAVKRIDSKSVIVAVPTFVAKHLVRSHRNVDFNAFQYAPWMVANIMVDSWLADRRGEPLAWDNVIYGSESLGYVSAQHQNVEMPAREKMITYYRALTGNNCAATRKSAMETTWEQWRDSVFADLKVAHRDIDKYATQMDVWVWGHGMIRPSPGLIWGDARKDARKSVDNKIFFAHSDLSGISIFEEAFESGINAANDVMKVV